MKTAQLDFQFEVKLGHPDRTPEHEQNEREAAAMGIPYPEPTRTLRFRFGGIRYKMFDAILSWRALLTTVCSACAATPIWTLSRQISCTVFRLPNARVLTLS